MSKKGFTLTEILVVVAIIAILFILALSMLKTNRDKAEDASSKSSLHRLKIAFEDYYADNNCYPPATFFDEAADCNSNNLTPYLTSVPCDKNTGLPYVLETDDTGCKWFKLYANLKLATDDPDALALCDSSGSTLGNYAVSSSNVVPLVACQSPSPTPSAPISSSTPSPSFDSSFTYYYCSAVNNCTSYNPATHICSPSYVDNPNCDGGVNKCRSIGSCTEL